MSQPETVEIPDIAQLIIDGNLTMLLGKLQILAVNQELGTPIGDRTKVKWTYVPMIDFRGAAPTFYYNGSREPMVEGTDYEFEVDTSTDPDTPVGRNFSTITLLSGGATGGTLEPGNEIRSDYVFQYFSDQELYYMVDMGLSELNLRKPATAYNWAGVPLDWNATIAVYAHGKCLERVIGDATLWETRVIFADPTQAYSHLVSKSQQVNQQLDFLMKVTKRRGEGKPRAISSARFSTQQRVTSVNWHQFAIQL
jgi:hypothetical protein